MAIIGVKKGAESNGSLGRRMNQNLIESIKLNELKRNKKKV